MRDRRPLLNRRILVTRSRDQAGTLVQLLEGLGAEALALPLIRIVPVEDSAGAAAIERACRSLASFDAVIFTSANGAAHFLPRCVARGRPWPAGLHVYAVGPRTAAVVEHHGLRVDHVAAEYRSEGVVETVRRGTGLRGRRLLLPRGDLAGAALPATLTREGAEPVGLTVYRTVRETSGADVGALLERGGVDAVTFTSGSTVEAFVESLGGRSPRELLHGVTVAVIGPTTAEAARARGLEPDVMPDQFTVPALVEALARHFDRRPQSTGPRP